MAGPGRAVPRCAARRAARLSAAWRGAAGLEAAALLRSSFTARAGSVRFYLLTASLAGAWTGGALGGGPHPVARRRLAHPPRKLLSDQRWQALAEAGARPQRVLWASTSTRNPDLPDTNYLGRLAAPDTIDTVPEQTLLAFADHGSLDDQLEPDYAAAERAISAAADAGIDADALAEHLQRHGAGAFTADWAALLTAIKEKAAKLTS
jgi:hypothetical protein